MSSIAINITAATAINFALAKPLMNIKPKKALIATITYTAVNAFTTAFSRLPGQNVFVATSVPLAGYAASLVLAKKITQWVCGEELTAMELAKLIVVPTIINTVETVAATHSQLSEDREKLLAALKSLDESIEKELNRGKYELIPVHTAKTE